ncbi:DUF3313 domain-containing protein [Omnitrophica bacterium]|nr:DUF3313 domain-containing protein [Candidatus Omnitrophota bacterium]
MGCASTHQASGYLESYRRLQEGDHFKQEYISPQVNFSEFSKAQVLLPNMDYLDNKDRFLSEELFKLADSFQQNLEEQLSETYLIISPRETPDEETLVVQPIITKIEPPERLLNLATLYLIGPSISSGHTAFEAKVLHGVTGEVLAEVAEKQTGAKNFRSLLYGGYTRFTHAKGAFKHWAKELDELLEDNSY